MDVFSHYSDILGSFSRKVGIRPVVRKASRQDPTELSGNLQRQVLYTRVPEPPSHVPFTELKTDLRAALPVLTPPIKEVSRPAQKKGVIQIETKELFSV